jgi:hypothetical protein
VKAEFREAVYERDVWCPVCGGRNNESSVIHHRKTGTGNRRDEFAWTLCVHSTCHNIAPGSIHQNPSLAYERGWLVPSWADPAVWALTLPTGARVLLSGDGNYQHITGETNGE